MNIYLIRIDLHSASGQLLRASDFNFKTKREAISNAQKILWLLGCSSEHFLISGFCNEVKIYLTDQNKYIEFSFNRYSY